MRNSWKKTAAFVLALTLVAAPLTQAGKGGLFGGSAITAKAAEISYSEFDDTAASLSPPTAHQLHLQLLH